MSGIISVNNIATAQREIPQAKNHPWNESFQTACESYQQQGYNIASARGVGNVFDDPTAYDNYKNTLFGDIANEDTRIALETLMDHERNDVLGAANGVVTNEDGSVSNVSVFSYLNGPVIRAIWARCIVPAVMKTVALKQTQYTITYDIPYVVVDGVRKNLPYDMVDSADPLIGLKKLTPRAAAGEHIAADGSLKFKNNVVVGNLLSESLTETVTAYDGRSIDANITIKNIKFHGEANASNTNATPVETLATTQGTYTPAQKNGKAGEIVFIIPVEGVYECKAEGDTAAATYSWEEADVPATVVVIVDLGTGAYKATSTSADIVSFEFDAYLSSEDNRTPAVMKTEQYSDTVTIGTGQHIMVDTPIELLQDYAPSHQGADYAVAMTDIVSEFQAGNMNVEMLRFFRNSLQNPASAQYIPQTVLRGINIPNCQFDVRVAHGENPAAYMDVQLKRCISYYINNIRSKSRIEDGYWNIVGHANDVMYIPDFKTEGFAQLNGDGDKERDDVLGFKVGYTFGFTTNVINGRVRCLYTPECTQASGMTAFFTSTDERRPTYIFHPYSYTISRGYQNPNNTTIPSLMVTKRHLFKEFVPSQFNLKLLNNDGTQFSSPVAVGQSR